MQQTHGVHARVIGFTGPWRNLGSLVENIDDKIYCFFARRLIFFPNLQNPKLDDILNRRALKFARSPGHMSHLSSPLALAW